MGSRGRKKSLSWALNWYVAHIWKKKEKGQPKITILRQYSLIKNRTDRDYNAALEFSIGHIDRIAVIVASHNEYSNLLATRLLQEKSSLLIIPMFILANCME